jgi:glycosyltransferase involved in cell wall biosynthesis
LDSSLKTDQQINEFINEIFLTVDSNPGEEFRKELSRRANELYSWENITNKWLEYF